MFEAHANGCTHKEGNFVQNDFALLIKRDLLFKKKMVPEEKESQKTRKVMKVVPLRKYG